MTENIIETKNLSFKYNKQSVLNGINLAVPQGSIYGYLGGNGAGKSTTLRLLLGLLPSPKGSIFIKGQDIREHNHELFYHIGSLIESPSIYKSLTCYEQLKCIGCYYSKGDKAINDVLYRVGIHNEKNKKISNLSTGMKQRLGIAIAIFHNPDILILDEPINGIDPNGVSEIRSLLLDLSKEGKTIMLSSHILSEMEKICNHIGILDSGDLLYQGSLNDLTSMMQREMNVTIASSKNDILIGDNYNFEFSKENMIKFTINSDAQYSQIINMLVAQGVDIYNIDSNMITLEDMYLKLLKDSENDK